MKVYVTRLRSGEYRITLNDYPTAFSRAKELIVPESAGRLLLAAQASADALKDSLTKMYQQDEGHHLEWEGDL